MEPEQIPQLLAEIALADPRVRRENPIERRAQVLMWAGILADVPYDAAVRYAQEHYTKSTWPVLPADIATRWAAAVRDRMNRHTGSFEPTAHPELDPDDIGGFQEALRAERQAVALGHTPPVELRELTGGPAAEVQARLNALGTYVPPHVRDALAEHRPTAAARAEALREGKPDALAVDCPVETCRAAVGKPCVRPGRGQTRRRIAKPHPSRTDAAQEARTPA